MTDEPASNDPQPAGQNPSPAPAPAIAGRDAPPAQFAEPDLDLLPEAEVPQSAADGPPAEAAAAPKKPAEPDRKSQIKTLQGEVKVLETQIVEEKKLIGQELIGQDSIPTERAEMLPLLEQGATLKATKSEKVAFKDSIQKNMEELAATQAQKKNLLAQRGEQHKLIVARYAGVGRAAYTSYLANPALKASFAEFFGKIIALDQVIAEKTAEKAALAEEAKGGLFSRIKAKVGDFTVKIPKEADRDRLFSAIGGQVMGNPDINQHIQSVEVRTIVGEITEPIGKLKEIDSETTALTEKEQGFNDTLNELKGEASTAKARLDQAAKEIAGIDTQLTTVLLPLADAFLQPTPDTAGRTDGLEVALARLKEAALKRTHARTQIARLNAEIRVDQIVKEREGILQKRHKLAQELEAFDRRLADLHEEHVRHHAFITKIAQGAAVDLDDEEKRETLVAVATAPLEADKVTNCAARGRLNIGGPNGETLYLELFGGQGLLFGRSHHDQKRGIRNDWVCRALPQDAPDAATKTRRISKVTGAFRGGSTPTWYMVDWSTAGITIDRAPVEKNGWITMPAEPAMIDIANGAVVLTANSYPSESLLLRRPAEEGRWYAVIHANLGLMVKDGVLQGTNPVEGGLPGFNIMFRDGHFGIAPRGGAPINLNGAPLASPQLLQNGAVIEHSGYSMSFNALEEGEPAL
jgi:hypothetical protein